jgi:hypothetical protein
MFSGRTSWSSLKILCRRGGSGARASRIVTRAETLFRDVIPREPARDGDADERHPDHRAFIGAAAAAVACRVVNRETHSQQHAGGSTDHGPDRAAFGYTCGDGGCFGVSGVTLDDAIVAVELGGGTRVLELCQFTCRRPCDRTVRGGGRKEAGRMSLSRERLPYAKDDNNRQHDGGSYIDPHTLSMCNPFATRLTHGVAWRCRLINAKESTTIEPVPSLDARMLTPSVEPHSSSIRGALPHSSTKRPP